MPERPLSPHLTVYKLRYTMVSSIVNRATGLVMSAGLLILLYWLVALSQGAEAYAKAQMVLSHWFFKVVLTGVAFTFCYHLVAGIRHLVWDTGRGLERHQSQKSAYAVGIISVLLTVIVVYLAFCPTAAV